MPLREEISNILMDPKYQNPESEADIAEDIFAIVSEENWPQVALLLCDNLQNNEMRAVWNDIATVFYYAIGKHLPVPVNRLIALLYFCIMETQDSGLGLHDDNLVWTITRDLKGVGYDSNYDPFQDPSVWEEIERLKLKR